MRTYTKTELETKVSNFNKELSNPFLTKSEKIRIESAIKYYITKLAELDETPNAKTIKA
ncbi:hypothetical protein [Yeosuana marina]|uniref:hypothetical protein n=1 Tax=Yeosuana marina TaxID=1565536 RepID=UPI0014219D16|nr:hypothetical protein [Yeosuana marina]